MADTVRILAVGDVVATAGCEKLKQTLPKLKKEMNIDAVIVNGENSAQGNGMTPFSIEQLFSAGADIITGGNHSYKRREVYDTLDGAISVIRPANYSGDCPGIGYTVLDKGFVRIGVINVLGTAFMDAVKNPLDCVDDAIAALEKDVKIIIVDFHAEATSEKRAFGFYVDGRVSAVFGTHTHVQTADEQILPNGTGYITDAGMTGPKQSVLGVKPEIIIERMKTNMPARFETAEGECVLEGVLFEIDKKTGRCLNVQRVNA